MRAQDWGFGSIAVIGLILGAWLWWHKDAPRFTTFLFLLGGTIIGGYLGVLLGTGLSLGIGALSTLSARAIGVGVSSIVAGLALVATLEVLVKGMSPLKKWKAKPKRWHPFLALVLPTIVVLAGVPLLSTIVRAVTSIGGA